MAQKERDRLVVLNKAKDGLITQKQAAAETGLTERQVRRLLRKLKDVGDKAVIHASTGGTSNRKIADRVRQEVVAILRQDVYKGFGPTLAAEYLPIRATPVSPTRLWLPWPRGSLDSHAASRKAAKALQWWSHSPACACRFYVPL